MNRELKFRVWDNLKKEWVSNKQIWRIKTDVGGYGEIFPPAIYWKQHPEGLTIQQYTGLQDKNGKDIYEGDIVKYSYRADMRDYHCIGYVKWFIPDDSNPNERSYAEASYVIDRNLQSQLIRVDNYHSLYRMYDRIVVGNIFENGDLIK